VVSQPEILNAVRELSRYMPGASLAHVKAMHRTIKYCVGSSEHGLLLKPIREWDGNPSYEFVITGRSDSDYAKERERNFNFSEWVSDPHAQQHEEECDIVGDGSRASRCDAMRARYAFCDACC
jgi:hypothetical protein